MAQVRSVVFVKFSGRAVAPPPRAVHRSRSSQIETQFQRFLDDHFPDPVAELCGSIHKISLSPVLSRKWSIDWAFEPTQRERSLSQESLDSTVSDNSAATPTSFATVSTITEEFEESQRALEYDADEESKKCPVLGCVKDVHHGKPCEKVPEGAHPEWAETDYATAQTYYNSVFLKDEPKTPPSQVMPQPEAPPPIKRRRASIMAPLDSKFQGKRLCFDALNTAFLYDSE